MSYFNSYSARDEEFYALYDCEAFYIEEGDDSFKTEDGDPYEAGWYYWYCFPGCLPDGDPMGPYETEGEAIAACREDASG